VKIFISYSAKDTHRVRSIADHLKADSHAEVHWWENSQRPGQSSWTQIFQWIDEADLVLVVISGNVLRRALAVGNEVGYAKAKNKLIIPLVCESPSLWAKSLRYVGAKVGIGTDDLACIGDLAHIRINEKSPEEGIHQLQEELRRIADEQKSKEASDAVLAVLALLGVGALLLTAK
jgi:TIR domain